MCLSAHLHRLLADRRQVRELGSAGAIVASAHVSDARVDRRIEKPALKRRQNSVSRTRAKTWNGRSGSSSGGDEGVVLRRGERSGELQDKLVNLIWNGGHCRRPLGADRMGRLSALVGRRSTWRSDSIPERPSFPPDRRSIQAGAAEAIFSRAAAGSGSYKETPASSRRRRSRTSAREWP